MIPKISLYLLTLAELVSLKTSPSRLGDLELIDGSLPPDFIIDAAITEIEKGCDVFWYGFFLFVLDGSMAVGSGGFRGKPENGRVEVGYGVAESFQGKGIATISITQLTQLALERSDVAEVFAETSVSNIASRRVVEKVGFHCIGQRDTIADGLVDQWSISL